MFRVRWEEQKLIRNVALTIVIVIVLKLGSVFFMHRTYSPREIDRAPLPDFESLNAEIDDIERRLFAIKFYTAIRNAEIRERERIKYELPYLFLEREIEDVEIYSGPVGGPD